MKSKCFIAIQAHKKVMPTQDEILTAITTLVREKIADSNPESKTISTFTVDIHMEN